MSELKPCQMSRQHAADKLQESFDYMSSVMPAEKRRPATSELLNALSIAISVLRAQPANETLTLGKEREQ